MIRFYDIQSSHHSSSKLSWNRIHQRDGTMRKVSGRNKGERCRKKEGGKGGGDRGKRGRYRCVPWTFCMATNRAESTGLDRIQCKLRSPLSIRIECQFDQHAILSRTRRVLCRRVDQIGEWTSKVARGILLEIVRRCFSSWLKVDVWNDDVDRSILIFHLANVSYDGTKYTGVGGCGWSMRFLLLFYFIFFFFIFFLI